MSDKEKAEKILQTKGCNTFCAKGCGYTEKVIELIAIGLAEGRKEVREHETTCVNRLHHLEKENKELKCCANCNDYLASVCKCNKIGEYRICDSVCKDWN